MCSFNYTYTPSGVDASLPLFKKIEVRLHPKLFYFLLKLLVLFASLGSRV